MRVTVHNDFHGTEARLNVKVEARWNETDDRRAWISARQAQRIRAKLCGVRDCTCGDALGMSGPGNPGLEEQPNGAIVLTGLKRS
jgi:hypothetical protein